MTTPRYRARGGFAGRSGSGPARRARRRTTPTRQEEADQGPEPARSRASTSPGTSRGQHEGPRVSREHLIPPRTVSEPSDEERLIPRDELWAGLGSFDQHPSMRPNRPPVCSALARGSPLLPDNNAAASRTFTAKGNWVTSHSEQQCRSRLTEWHRTGTAGSTSPPSAPPCPGDDASRYPTALTRVAVPRSRRARNRPRR